MKKLLFLIGGVLLSNVSLAQNPGWILAPKFIPNMAVLPTTTSLPLGTALGGNPWDGYNGAEATTSQNIIVDDNDKIVFFMVDQYIYGRNGQLVDIFTNTINLPQADPEIPVTGIGTEVVIIPSPNDCKTYYIVSTAKYATGVSFTSPVYGTLVIEYDPFGNLISGSGLEDLEEGNCYNKAVSLANLIGQDYYDFANNWHDEGPIFAAIPKNGSNDKFLFMNNGRGFFRLTVDGNGISYDNYKLNMINVFPMFAGALDNNNNHRREMEVIRLGNGNYRVAIPLRSSVNADVGIGIFDLDNNGVLIPGSQKFAGYPLESGFPVLYIHGLELSPLGNMLYVTHNTSGTTTSTFDVFDITGPVPVKSIISSSPDYKSSQIEATFDNVLNQSQLLIPSSDGLDKIVNADSPTFTLQTVSLQTKVDFSLVGVSC